MSVAMTTFGKKPKNGSISCENENLVATRSTKQENQNVHYPCPSC